MTEPMSDDFEATLKFAILGAFGFSSEAELDAAVAKALGPTCLEATAEYRAREAAYHATLPGRMEEARQAATDLMRSRGVLPDGVELVWSVETVAICPLCGKTPWTLGDEHECLTEPPQFTGILAALDGTYAGTWDPPVEEKQ